MGRAFGKEVRCRPLARRVDSSGSPTFMDHLLCVALGVRRIGVGATRGGEDGMGSDRVSRSSQRIVLEDIAPELTSIELQPVRGDRGRPHGEG